MKVLVTGGTGFVGRHLVRSLLEESHEVVVPSRDPDRARETLSSHERLTFVHWRGSESETLDLTTTDAIYHLAGEPAVGRRYTPKLKKQILSSRLDSTRSLLRSLDQAERRPRMLLSASGVGYYGARTPDELLDETKAPGHDFLAQVCVQWERAVRMAGSLGVRTVSCRFGIVLGPDGGALPVLARPFRFFVGGPLGDGKQMMPWVHVDDVIGAMRFLQSTSNAHGAFNVVAPGIVDNNEFTRTLGHVLRRPGRLRAPGFTLRTLFGEGAQPLLTGQHAVPARLLDAGFRFRFSNLEAALDDCLTS